MTIIFNSTCVSGVIALVMTDGNGVVSPIDVTGFALEARYWDVGHVGRWEVSDAYGGEGSWQGDTPLLTITSAAGGVVVDDAEAGLVHLVLTPAQSLQIQTFSRVERRQKRRLVRQIWRTDSGAEAMLHTATEWASP